MFDNPLILLLILAAALLRWFTQKSDTDEEPKRPTIPGQPIPRGGETQTEEERIRRFLEALGQPTTSTPPPKVKRRSIAPKSEVSPQIPPFGSPPLPPLTTAPPPLVIEPPPVPTFPTSTTQVSLPSPIEHQVFKPKIPEEAGFEVRDLGTQVSSDLSPGVRRTAEERGFILKLASTQDLRSAIVLREIFGPPRSLQPVNLVSGF